MSEERRRHCGDSPVTQAARDRIIVVQVRMRYERML